MRNTALQRDFEGRIALTPLYDFAPMYLHPDGIARRIRWKAMTVVSRTGAGSSTQSFGSVSRKRPRHMSCWTAMHCGQG